MGEYTYLFVALSAMIIIPAMMIFTADFFEVEGYTPTNSTTMYHDFVQDTIDYFGSFDDPLVVVIGWVTLFAPALVFTLILIDFSLGWLLNPLLSTIHNFISSLVIFDVVGGIAPWVKTLLIAVIVGIPVLILFSKLPLISGQG